MFGLSTELITKGKLSTLANARNVSTRISLRWLNYFINSVNKTITCFLFPGGGGGTQQMFG